MPYLFSPDTYHQQLNKKVDDIKTRFKLFDLPPIHVYESPKSHYRMRAEFRMWHDDSAVHSPYPIMFNRDNKQAQRIVSFPIANHCIDKLVQLLPEKLQPYRALKTHLFQIECLSNKSQDLLLTLIYRRKLDDASWKDQAQKLTQSLQESGLNVSLIGRSKKQKITLANDFIDEQFSINNQTLNYKQLEGSFTQPNAHINQQMLHWVSKVSKNLTDDALELYCGNGNFTLALAQNFKRVFATEVVKSAVATARENAQKNGFDNVAIARLSSEEFTQANQRIREFRRLKELDINLDNYHFSTVLVDPPRSGLDDKTCAMISTYANIIYISCNPDSLKSNLSQLCKTHHIHAFSVFDQFPYTEHVECGVHLLKR